MIQQQLLKQGLVKRKAPFPLAFPLVGNPSELYASKEDEHEDTHQSEQHQDEGEEASGLYALFLRASL